MMPRRAWRRTACFVVLLAALGALFACGDDAPDEPLLATATPGRVVPTPDLPALPTLTPTSTPRPAPTATPTPIPASFVPDVCPIESPSGVQLQCGALDAPENRDDYRSRRIKIPVVILLSTSDNPRPDPILYLAGGPGSSILETAKYRMPLFEHFLSERDVVLIEQRGVGLADPALDCPESTRSFFENVGLPLSRQEQREASLQALRDCRERLAAEGADLAGYHTMSNAQDVADVIRQLGYPEWNLYGVSYGTRLALAVMRDHPDRIRSVILDSTLPLDVDFLASIAPNADRAFQKLFDACAASPPCNMAYPDLEAKLYDVASQLDESPGRAMATNPFNGQTYEVAVTGDRLVRTVFDSLYVEPFIPLLPQLIHDAGAGNYELFGEFFGVFAAQMDFLSSGMHHSLQCADEAQFTTRERVAAAAGNHGDLARRLLPTQIFDVCAFWGSGVNRNLKTGSVSSDIPTLALAGEFDPVTPPDWGRRAIAQFSRGYFFEFKGGAHSVIDSNECTIAIFQAFLAEPDRAPDGACAAELTAAPFKTPASAGVVLVPFEDTTLNVRGVAPAGWVELAPGVYGQTPLGEVVILQQALATTDAPLLLPSFRDQWNATLPAEPDQRLDIGGSIWAVYAVDVESRRFSLAISGDRGGRTYFIVLASDPEGYDALYRNVFLPAMAELGSAGAE